MQNGTALALQLWVWKQAKVLTLKLECSTWRFSTICDVFLQKFQRADKIKNITINPLLYSQGWGHPSGHIHFHLILKAESLIKLLLPLGAKDHQK